MACAHPFLRTDKKSIKEFHPQKYLQFYIPCGWCLNCRVDKQNELQHRCEKELINYKCGAFVTVTYDDYHIINNLVHDSAGKLCATLSKTDTKKFLDRLRHNIKNNMPNNLLSSHKFKYLVVGEYGGDGQVFDRPHMHFLFFGLDFAVCKQQFEKAWQGQGLIEVDPILQGGISYVLKYLDKQLFGKQAENKYDKNNLVRPFQNHSLGLGSSLYEEQKEYIKSHNGNYRWKGKDIPVPPYYKDKYLIKRQNFALYNQAAQEKYKLYNGHYAKNLYDLHDFKMTKNLLRESEINKRLELDGRPRYDYMSINELKFHSEKYISELAKYAYIAQVPF